MPRIVLSVAYNGQPFLGWQTQPGGNTVQDNLELALSAIAGHPVNTVCAGRTDTGVHACGQVVHFDTSTQRPLHAWVRGVNSHLPDAVAVLTSQAVRADFHARFDALERRYVYYLSSSPVRHPLLAGRAGWVHRPLDPQRIALAVRSLLGTHDFSAFRSSQCQAKSPVRTLNRVAVACSGSMIRMEFSANAFLHHMIRNIVGTLVYAGDGRRPVEWVAEVLASRQRALAAPTFSPEGLYFDSVRYPDGDMIQRVAHHAWPGDWTELPSAT